MIGGGRRPFGFTIIPFGVDMAGENSLHTAWAGYSAGSGNPQRLPLVRESGSHACYSPQFSHSQFGSQYFGLPRVSC